MEMSPDGREDHPSSVIKHQLLDRQESLRSASQCRAADGCDTAMGEIDAALERLDNGSYGRCLGCHDEIEEHRLEADPTTRFCLDCLDAAQRRDLERDLELASTIQRALLPPLDYAGAGWQVHYLYRPHGVVSGDYVDVIERSADEVLVLVGDVSGKGVAAALLMSHLHAIFRGMAGLGVPLTEMVGRANRLLCAATPSSAFATLIATRLSRSGRVELCNAGHLPLLVVDSKVEALAGKGLPLGMFCDIEYRSHELELAPGDRLLLYTDGLTEGTNACDEEYGVDTLQAAVARHGGTSVDDLIRACLEDLERFQQGSVLRDDLTVLAARRASSDRP